MKKNLFVLGLTLLVAPSAMASNWGYATNTYDPPCATCQNGAVYQNTTSYQQPGSYQRPVSYQTANSYQNYGTYRAPVAYQEPVQNAQHSPVYRKPAQKNKSSYRINNPLYHPTKGQGLFALLTSYHYTPKEEKVGRDEMTGWTFGPGMEYGITDKLSLIASGNYARYKVKSGPSRGKKIDLYDASVGMRYLMASFDGFDFNARAGLYYEKDRVKHHLVMSRRTGTDIALQLGKKIENITPYFTVGFKTDFWSKRHSGSGTDTYINPGVYIDLLKNLSLNLDYVSFEHGDATYRATLDFYPTDVGVISLGGFIIHPETDRDTYGATAGVKVAF